VDLSQVLKEVDARHERVGAEIRASRFGGAGAEDDSDDDDGDDGDDGGDE
jgi:hypothetical protein